MKLLRIRDNRGRTFENASRAIFLSPVVLSALISVFVVAGNHLPAAAQASGSASADSASGANAGAPSAVPTPAETPPSAQPAAPAAREPLKGSVQMVELNLELLRDVGIDLKQLLKAASSLYDEVTIQPVRLVTQPEVVGAGIMINIPIATQPVGPPQPARKDRVDLAMNNMRPIIKLMKSNVDEFITGDRKFDLPSDVIATLKPHFKAWAATVNAVAETEKQLEQMTAGPPYNNAQIADAAVAIEKDVKDLDKTRHAIYKVIRKEGKRRAATASK